MGDNTGTIGGEQRCVGGILVIIGGGVLFLSGLSSLYWFFRNISLGATGLFWTLYIINQILVLALGVLILVGGITILTESFSREVLILVCGIGILIWGIIFEIVYLIEYPPVPQFIYVDILFRYIIYTLHAHILIVIGGLLCYRNRDKFSISTL